MKKITVCGYCGVGCGLEADLDKLKISGNSNHITNGGLLCSKGSSQLKFIAKDRVLKPLFRKNIDDQFSHISWNDALEIISSKIKKTAPDKIGFYLSGQLLNEDYYLANKLAKGFIKTNHVDTNSRTCMASAVVGYKKSLGLDFVPVTQNDAIESDLFILIGSNIAESHIVFSQKIKSARKRGLKVIVIDPRNTKTADFGDLHIKIKSGKDLFFLNAVSKRLFELGEFNPNIELIGYEDYLKKLEEVDVLQSLSVAGVSEDDFNQFLDFWVSSNNIVSSWTMGINQSVNGVASNLAIINLHLLTGKIFLPKNGPLSLTGQPNAMGGREVGGLATTLAVHLDYTSENVKKVEEFWDTSEIPQKSGLTAFEMVENGNLDLLLVSHTDPVFHLPNRNLIEEKFREIDFVVELNSYQNSETSKFAHLILPASPFGEKLGTQTNLDRVVNLQTTLFPKSGESLQDWEIFAKIGEKLGFGDKFNFRNSEEVFEEYKRMTKLSPDIDIWKTSYEELKNEPFRWGENFKFQKANLIFPQFLDLSERVSDNYPLQLLTGRLSNSWHSGTKVETDANFVQISEEDSERYNLKSGNMVKISSRYGDVTLKVDVSKSLEKGYIFIPMHFRGVNYLTNSLLDPFSKEPDYRVSVNIKATNRIF
jgi:ferredoxin-nitrate reductase